MLRRLAAVSLAALAASGCAMLGLGKKEPIAARVGDEVITVAEVDQQIKDDLWKRQTNDGNAARVHEVRMAALRMMLAQRALDAEAKKRGVTTDQMLDAEFKSLPPVDDAAVKAFYDENAAMMQGRPLEAVAPQIRAHLESDAKHKAVDAILDKTPTKILLEQPRVAVTGTGPARGPADARVTIVEFSDFQCPFCGKAKPVLDEVEKRHPNDVRIVYRHLPLDMHARAKPSAEAAACAEEGNKFWEYHDKLFANQQALGDQELRKYAAQVGLDAKTFDECVSTRRQRAKVEADAQEAKRLGITGTPAFVVNGIMMSGLKTADDFDEVIRDELSASSTAAATPTPGS
jgi:protein-disulfide isomerase